MAAAKENMRITGELPIRNYATTVRHLIARGGGRRIVRHFTVAALLALVMPFGSASSLAAEGLASSLGWNGATWLNTRLRHERVFDDAPSRAASANTVRARIGAVSAPRNGFTILGELEAVSHVGSDSFNDGANGETGFASVPDPETAEINQLALRYDRGSLGLVVGRQRIVLDRARFVGDADFRQNQQTFDAATAVLTPRGGVRVRLDYMTDALRPGPPHAGLGSLDLDGYLFHLNWRTRRGVDASGFAYFLDFDDAPALSTATVGARIEGGVDVNSRLRVVYEASLAQQRDHGNNPRDFSLPYWLVAPGIASGAFEASVGLERLDGNGRSAVSTPLGTLHAYQGFADLFTETPASGIEDRFLRADYKRTRVGPFDSVRLWGQVHRYAAATTGDVLGREVDLALSASLNRAYRFTAMAAHYDSESFGSDTQKYWLALDISF